MEEAEILLTIHFGSFILGMILGIVIYDLWASQFEESEDSMDDGYHRWVDQAHCRKKIAPITEGPSKGRQNPPNISSTRPPAPQGSQGRSK